MCNFRQQEQFENLENVSTVKIETQNSDTLINDSSLKTEQNIKEGTNIVKVEINVPETDEANGNREKMNTEADVKNENMKMEQISRPMVSPHKRKRSRLNF